jgi:hypothetical protein
VLWSFAATTNDRKIGDRKMSEDGFGDLKADLLDPKV